MIRKILAGLVGGLAVGMLGLSAVALAAVGDVDQELLQAAKQGNVAEVQSLLGRGADPNGRDKFKRTPLLLAARR